MVGPGAHGVQDVVDLLAERLGALAMLWLVDENGTSLAPYVAGARDDAQRRALLDLMSVSGPSLHQGFVGQVVRTREPVLIPRVTPDDLADSYPPYADFTRSHGIGSLAIVPLVAAEQVVGALGVGRLASAEPLDDDDLGHLSELADQAAPVVAGLRDLPGLRLHREVIEGVSDAVIATDADFIVTAWNPAAERLYGLPATDALGQRLRSLVQGLWYAVEDGRGGWTEQVEDQTRDALVRTGGWRGRTRQRRPDGGDVLVEGHVSALTDADGAVTGYVSINRDIGALVAAEQELATSRLLAQTLLEASPAVNVVVDADGSVVGGNTAWLRTLAEVGQEEDTDSLLDWLSGAVNAGPLLPVVQAVLDGERPAVDLELEFVDPHGASRWLSGQMVTLSGGEGAVLALVDVTARRALERRLAHRAQYDPLTGQPNRSALMIELARALTRSARTGSRVAVVFCDLDRFKDVNDSLGHEQGDIALREAAGRIVAAARGHELVARFGGDEFVVVVEDVSDAEDVLPLAGRILAAFQDPVVLGAHEVQVGVSIGIAVSSGHALAGEAEGLLSEADIAMYEAKDEGRGRAVVFREEMRERIRTRLALAAGLRRAVENDELELVYQPIARVTDGSLIEIEAFVRWRHPGRGLLGPDAFLSAAEDSGAIVGVGEWVLDNAIAQLAAWGDRLGPDVSIGVNMSPRQLADPELVLDIAEALERHGVPGQRLSLEFNEAALLDDPEAAVATLLRLSTLGVGLAIDDFGTGLSSLSRLEEVPFRLLKVDRHLVARADREPRAGALVNAVASLVHARGVLVTAGGVETAGQLAAVRAAGCDAYQGYLLSRPLPGPELPAALGR